SRLPGRVSPAARAARQPPAARPAAPHSRRGARRDRRSRPVLRQRGGLQRDQPRSIAPAAAAQARQRAGRLPGRHRDRQPRLPAAAQERPRRARQPRQGQTPGRDPRSSFAPMTVATDLRAVLTSSRVLDAPAELRTYAYDASFLTQLAPRPPDAVVIAGSTEDVSAVMRYANQHAIPVTPRGA